MFRLSKSFAVILLGSLSLALMLFLFAKAPYTSASAGDNATMPTLAPEPATAQKGLPAERAELYRAALLEALRTNYDAVPRRLDTLLPPLRAKLGRDPSKAEVQAEAERISVSLDHKKNKSGGANPLAYLGRLKAKEMAQAAGAEAAPALTGNPKLLTVMLNFTGKETYTTADPVAFNTYCLTDTSHYTTGFQVVIDGPRFNELSPPHDNSVPWLDPATSPTGGFTKEYYHLLLYSTTGDTSVMRPELPNPWTGGNGYDFSGVSFRNFYVENSRGRYTPEGEVYEVSIPEAVSYFGAARCDSGYTDDGYNETSYTFVISAAQQINLQFPGAAGGTNDEFNWADYDIEDTFDYDNDGNFNEPDGYVDHFFLLEAGQAEGGPFGEFQIWPHSSDVNPADPSVGPDGYKVGGYQVAANPNLPRGGIWILNYTVSDEVGGLGTLVHEYGHDIGLPDNYAFDGSGPNPGFWDLMNAGVFGGGISGMQPSHMNIWDKEFLGWNNPVEINLANPASAKVNGAEANATEFTIGQQSKPPSGTVDGLRIDLPDIVSEASVTPYDNLMWWSDRGNDRSESIARNFNVQAGETVTVSAQLAYFIEEEYDYLYWEISSTLTNGWVPLKVYDGATELTTDEDPNGANSSGNGITGAVADDDWVHATATITPGMHAGGAVAFRFHYLTDAGAQEEGIYLDNISIVGSKSGTILTDDAEDGDKWTHLGESINKSNPWMIFDGIKSSTNYYLVEWRNSGEETGAHGNSDTAKAFATAGFDIGLNRMYWISQLDQYGNIVRVDPFSMHTPGMLIWYVDNRYTENELFGNLEEGNSSGAKARLLAVDANPNPYHVDDPNLDLLQITERRSAFDAAYSLLDRPAFVLTSNLTGTGALSTTQIPAAAAKPAFHDRIGVVPGITGEPPDDAFYVDSDAGVVLPSRDDLPYRAAWDVFQDTGNPGLVGLGINLEVVDQAEDGTWGKIRFTLDNDTIFFTKKASVKSALPGQIVTFTLSLKDASGTRYADDFNYTYPATMTDQLPEGAVYVAKSLKVIDGPRTATPSSVAISGTTITWHGVLGGNPLDTPDAVVSYRVRVDAQSGALANTATLAVEPQLIDTDTFSETLELPYYWPKQTTYVAGAQVKIGDQMKFFLPGIHR